MRLRTFLVLMFTTLLLMTFFPNVDVAAQAASYDADVTTVRHLFEHRQFSKLTTLLEKYQSSCEQDIRWEFAVIDCFNLFASNRPEYKGLVDEWVRKMPGKWVPLLARASYHDGRGWRARGGKWANETSEEQFERMKKEFEFAVRDVEAALRINPRLYCAYLTLMNLNTAGGDQQRGRQLAEKALEIYPDSYFLRRVYMSSITPRWGGSYKAMERFAKESMSYAKKNPLVKSLPGFVALDQAVLARDSKDYKSAILLHEKALGYGENWNFLNEFAETLFQAGFYDRALPMVEKAVAMRPNNATAYGLRSRIFFSKKNWTAALKDLEKMEQVGGPGSEEAGKIRSWECADAMWEGSDLSKKKDFPGAIDRFTAVLRLEPRNDKAYFERAGAYARMGDNSSAGRDLKQACDLGNSEACRQLKTLRARMGSSK